MAYRRVGLDTLGREVTLFSTDPDNPKVVYMPDPMWSKRKPTTGKKKPGRVVVFLRPE